MLHLEHTFKLPFLFVVSVQAGEEKHGKSKEFRSGPRPAPPSIGNWSILVTGSTWRQARSQRLSAWGWTLGVSKKGWCGGLSCCDLATRSENPGRMMFLLWIILLHA